MADANAQRVWTFAGGPGAFGWRDCFPGVAADVLAQYVARYPERDARALYQWGLSIAGDKGVAWEQLPAALRCAVEVFRASFAVLHAEILVGKGKCP